MALALALLATAGCSGDEPKQPSKANRNSAVARCAGYECKVRLTCKGRVTYRYGPAPVQIHSSKTALRTTFTLDFAGSKADQVYRC